jgi:hypothetical protein
MKNLIFRAVAKANSLLNRFQAKQFLSVVLVGFLVLTSPIASGRNVQAVEKRLDQVIHQDDSTRPKTTGEWKQEARETAGEPGERAKRIGAESADAIKDFGALYPDVAKRSKDTLDEQSSQR